VNFTAGLNKVRTSPDHGTGFDIAGKNIANEGSFREAVYSAIDIYKNRIEYNELTNNPLKKASGKV
jgi:4-hydroxy-L-threonine phosphate dehydrogenase PdxA